MVTPSRDNSVHSVSGTSTGVVSVISIEVSTSSDLSATLVGAYELRYCTVKVGVYLIKSSAIAVVILVAPQRRSCVEGTSDDDSLTKG